MIDLALDALAAHRLARLVTKDTITRPLRKRIIVAAYLARDGDAEARSEAEWDELPHQDENAPKLAAFIVCPWCTGLWISLGIVVARRYAAPIWDPIARALALSTAAALVARLEDD